MSTPVLPVNSNLLAKHATLMPQHRLFISQPLEAGQNVEIDGDRAHYLSRVLRMKTGSKLVLFTGDGHDYPAVVSAARKTRVVLRVGEAVRNDRESPLMVQLVQGISRGERMDFAVQKATELGVHRILPVFTKFSVVKLDTDRAARRVQHWQKIAQGACEQSGRNRVPLIEAPIALNDYFGNESAADCRIALVPGATTALHELAHTPQTVDLLVGPEGGLSENEAADAANAGFLAVSLGPRILRSETAALTALALAQSKWGDV